METINQAGMQTTLSQMMTKEFLLISRGTKVSMYKSMLFSSMQRFNSTLHALRVGAEETRAEASWRLQTIKWLLRSMPCKMFGGPCKSC